MASKKVKTKLTEATLKLTRKLQNIKDESEEAKLLIDSIVNHVIKFNHNQNIIEQNKFKFNFRLKNQ